MFDEFHEKLANEVFEEFAGEGIFGLEMNRREFLEAIEAFVERLNTVYDTPPISEEENERRFKDCLRVIRNITREELVELMGEDFLEEFRRVSQR